jgi:hypothetical protein
MSFILTSVLTGGGTCDRRGSLPVLREHLNVVLVIATAAGPRTDAH